MSIINLTNPGMSPVTGDIVEITYDTGTIETKEYYEPSITIPVTTFNLSNLVITRNGGLAVPQNGNKYYLNPGDSVEVVGDIVNDSDELQIAISAPMIKLPIIKHADDKPTADELYFSGSITSGVLTVSGTFTQSGNYKALAWRINKALDRLDAGFGVTLNDVDFLV
jgi:hypothetical protein